jgi:hypothetical protein
MAATTPLFQRPIFHLILHVLDRSWIEIIRQASYENLDCIYLPSVLKTRIGGSGIHALARKYAQVNTCPLHDQTY